MGGIVNGRLLSTHAPHLKNIGLPIETMGIPALVCALGALKISIYTWNWGEPFDLDFCDMHRANMILPGISRCEVLPTLRELNPRNSVRDITCHNTWIHT